MSKQATKIRGKSKKGTQIDEIGNKLGKAKTFFLTDYRGLTHQQLETLRKTLKKAEGEFMIAKNSLLKIAIEKWNKDLLPELESHLAQPTAAFFAKGDEVTAIKEMSNFIKTLSLPKIKIGVFGGKVATEKDFTKLATLPTRDVLLATLAVRMKSPVNGLHYALKWNLNRLAYALNGVKAKKG